MHTVAYIAAYRLLQLRTEHQVKIALPVDIDGLVITRRISERDATELEFLVHGVK